MYPVQLAHDEIEECSEDKEVRERNANPKPLEMSPRRGTMIEESKPEVTRINTRYAEKSEENISFITRRELQEPLFTIQADIHYNETDNQTQSDDEIEFLNSEENSDPQVENLSNNNKNFEHKINNSNSNNANTNDNSNNINKSNSTVSIPQNLIQILEDLIRNQKDKSRKIDQHNKDRTEDNNEQEESEDDNEENE